MLEDYDIKYVLVDDDEDDRLLIGRALRQLARPLPVLEFEDGQEFLNHLPDLAPDRTHEPIYWVVLMDVHMPVLDGYETVSMLRQHPQGRDLPVLMVSGTDDTDFAQKAQTCGANACIRKPVSQHEYVTRLSSYVAPLLREPPQQWPAYTHTFWNGAFTPGSSLR